MLLLLDSVWRISQIYGHARSIVGHSRVLYETAQLLLEMTMDAPDM